MIENIPAPGSCVTTGCSSALQAIATSGQRAAAHGM